MIASCLLAQENSILLPTELQMPRMLDHRSPAIIVSLDPSFIHKRCPQIEGANVIAKDCMRRTSVLV